MASAVKDVGKTFLSDPKHLKVRIESDKAIDNIGLKKANIKIPDITSS